jgi:N-acetylneuraminate synthase
MKYNNILEIENVKIGKEFPTYFIADIAANHDGDLERAKDLIWAAKEAGANAAKFQHFKAESIVSNHGFNNLGGQKSHQAKWKSSVYDVYKAASVSLDWTEELKATCEKAKITFFTSPYAFDLVDAIDKFVPAYKIGSGDITWIEIIKYIANKNKPYIIATGASNFEDVIRAVSAGIEINPQIALLQCNTNYTGNIENMGYVQLNVLKTYEQMFPEMVLGLSDHTPGHATVIGAITLGARIIEKHFTDNVSRIGPDHAFSMDPETWRNMIDRSRELEAALGVGIKKIEKNELETVVIQRRSIRLKNDLEKNHIIKKEDVEMLRPCPLDALNPYQLEKILGKKLNRKINRGEYIKITDLNEE